MIEYTEKRDETGFSLVELLIAIVVVGILTAVAIVSIGGVADKGTKSACAATKDAIQTAQSVHFANFNTYPADFGDMIVPASGQPELVLSGGATATPAGANADTITGSGGWTDRAASRTSS